MSFSTPMAFTVANGTVTLDFSTLETGVGGDCLYAGRLTGTMTNGSNRFQVGGQTQLVRPLSGTCRSARATELVVTLPGAVISW